jgi:cytoskeletal protein RodZ
MTVRTTLGAAWSILVGMAGGWLVLMPWALGEQGAGSWTTVTKVSLGTGLGLLVFALVGSLAVGVQVVMLLRPRRERAAATEEEEEVDQASVERALMQLATKLIADLERDPTPAAAGPVTPTSPTPTTATQPTVPQPTVPNVPMGAQTNGMPGQPHAPATPAEPHPGEPDPGGAPAQEIWKRTER